MKKVLFIKRIIALLLCFSSLLALFGCGSKSSFEIEAGSNGNCAIVKYTGSEENVVVPDTIDGMTVDRIAQSAFYGSEMKTLELPATVKTIEIDAFSCCSAESVIIPDGVEEIGMWAFERCIDLEEITLPESVVKIGGGAFRGCIALETVVLPDSLTVIPEGMFEGCPNLRNVNIPDSVHHIMNRAFRNCDLLETLTIPSGVEKIGEYAFEACTSLTVYAPHPPEYYNQYEPLWNAEDEYPINWVVTE